MDATSPTGSKRLADEDQIRAAYTEGHGRDRGEDANLGDGTGNHVRELNIGDPPSVSACVWVKLKQAMLALEW